VKEFENERKLEIRNLKNRKEGSGNGVVLRRMLRGSVRYFVICILSGVTFTALELIIPQILRLTVDSVIGDKPVSLPDALKSMWEGLGGAEYFRAHMGILAAMLIGVGLLSAVFRYAMNLYSSIACETMVKTSRDLLYHQIERLPWSWHMKNATGDIIQRCTADVERIKTFFQEQFVSVFRIIVLIVLSLACMVAMNWRLSIIALVMFPIIILYSLLFHNKIRERFTDCDEAEGVLSTIAQENLTGVRVVRAFGREEFERARFEAQNQEYTSLWVKLCYTLSQFWAVGDVTSCLQVMLVVVFGSILCVRGDMTKGEFISFAFYNAMLITPVRRLGRMISEMSKAGVSVDRLAEVLNAPVEEDAPGAKIAPMDKDISFAHVSFSYETGPEVLHDVSFTIPAGSSFGILGATGSGKSTLLLLLSRLYAPAKGKITVGGVDLASMPAKWVRENVGVVLQEPFLFSRTIEENIGITGATAEEIRAAAITACVDGDIRQFAKGYDTMVGERGVTLSGGQKQRVAIARTLTQKTPVIVFDDSLSAVDTETDESIRKNLSERVHGVTQILVSHRILTLLGCDRVLVLEHGRVKQLGTPEELLQQGGLFREIYQVQMTVGEEEPA
jgi:ATP-binding cassette subfamily B protein